MNKATTFVILNPYARRWTALKRRPEAEAALTAAGVKYELVQTERPGHAIDLAEQAAKNGFHQIIAAGGDSTINEVVNGLLKAKLPTPPSLGILPLGTANDFSDNFGLPRELDQCAKLIHNGYAKPVDVCEVNQRYFINNSGIGLEPSITRIQMGIHRVQGIVRYLLATMIGIWRNPQWHMRLTWQDGEYDGPVTLVSIGNGPRTGGFFFLTPGANMTDGLLTFTMGYAPSRSQLLSLLPKAILNQGKGLITDNRAFQVSTSWLSIHAQPATPFHTDGEVISDEHEFLYKIHPKLINVISQP